MKLWGEIWNCSDTIKKNGRSGQIQCGVDVYGAPNNGIEYYGIQCKCKDNCTKSQLTKKEIDEEIEKAKSFKPQLKVFYFATTAVRDAKIEEYIREKNIESRTNGGFGIDVFSWEDIVYKLKENRDTYNWYINDCQYIDNTDVAVYFQDKVHRVSISPQYYIYSQLDKNRYETKEQKHSIFDHAAFKMPSMAGTIDLSWCEVELTIENIGSSVIHDYMVKLTFESVYPFNIDDDFGGKAKTGVAAISGIALTRYVDVNETFNLVEYRPKQNRLVQTDRSTFSFYIKPETEEQEIQIKWEVKSANYSKSGILVLESKYCYIKRYSKDTIADIDLDADGIIIEPVIKEI
ncbi:hypothetical protein BN938_0391 [Mucinivorans hirudinis]|uniref:Mrr-like domain-containing protein n=1 Tax=Mucinivorans hirudinis TaxID=1433126 RepID=A0A060R666_9BACT|nr:hypothetical protein BN938_0391 [Mucinivorans hirudinis]